MTGRAEIDYETGLPESVEHYTKRTLLDPNIVERGGMAPVGKDKEGNVVWPVMPEFLIDAMEAYALPDHVYQGGGYSVDDAVNFSLENMGAGLLSSKAIPNTMPEGAVLGANVFQRPKTTLPMEKATRNKRAISMGYPDITDKSNWYYTQTDLDRLKSILTTGFRVNRYGAARSDEVMPKGVFTKPNVKQVEMLGGRGKKKVQIPLVAKEGKEIVFENRDALERLLDSDHEYVQFRDNPPDKVWRLNEKLAEAYNAIEDMNARILNGFDSQHTPSSVKIINNYERLDRLFDREYYSKLRQMVTDKFKKSGYSRVRVKNDVGAGGTIDTTVHLYPENLRSPLGAEFDPKKKRSRNILASLVGGGSVLSAYGDPPKDHHEYYVHTQP